MSEYRPKGTRVVEIKFATIRELNEYLRRQNLRLGRVYSDGRFDTEEIPEMAKKTSEQAGIY